MNQDALLPYAKGDGWQAIELAYQGGTAAMDIIVPDEGRFEDVELSMDNGTASTIMESLQPTSVSLAMPKFQFESEFGLADQLGTLGMKDAFDPDTADFSGMTGRDDLYISAILHKAFVAVDEKGTEAAAATAVIVGVTSAPMFDVTLTIDRPFIFFIRDIPTGQILFIGRVLNPAQ
jgi:serpin B